MACYWLYQIQVYINVSSRGFVEGYPVTRTSIKNFVNDAPVMLNTPVIQGAELFPAYPSGTGRAKSGSGTWQPRSMQTQYNCFEKSETETHAKDIRSIAPGNRQGLDHWKKQS